MKKVALDIGYDDDYVLVGISTSEKNYRLAWLLNKHLEFSFERVSDIQFFLNEVPLAGFARFDYSDDLNRLNYYLIENKDETVFLVPELKNIHFLLIIKGALEYFNEEAFVKKTSTLSEIQFVTVIDQQQLRSKHNLIIPELNHSSS